MSTTYEKCPTAVYRMAGEILNQFETHKPLVDAEVKIDYNPATQEAKLLRGGVISKTGERQEISPGEINVMDAGWNAAAKRYTGGKILVANLPNVEIGSTIEVEFEITQTNRPFLAGFDSFQLPDALTRKVFELTAPKPLKVQTLTTGVRGAVQESRQTENGRQTFRWSAENVAALPMESQLPPEWTYNAGIGYFIGEAKDYYQTLNATLLDRAAKSAQAAKVARQLTAAATNRLEALQAIRDFITKSIRVAGPTFADLPLTELSAADTTLADGYGHLADRAILYHAMLTAAGFKPEFVLASELPALKVIATVTKAFPLPQNFQTPLVRVTVDGEAYYLNDTDQYSQLGTTPHATRLALKLRDGSFMEIKAAKKCEENGDSTYTLELADNGQAHITISQQFYGGAYNQKKRYFSELPPEERRRYFQEVVSSVAQGARPAGELVTDFVNYPGIEKFSVVVDNYAVVDGNYFYFDLPHEPSLFPTGADTRALPLFISRGGKSTVRTEILLPPSFGRIVIAPSGKKVSAVGNLSAKVTTHEGNGKFLLTHELSIAPVIVAPKDYSSLLNAESALREKSSRAFLLQKN